MHTVAAGIVESVKNYWCQRLRVSPIGLDPGVFQADVDKSKAGMRMKNHLLLTYPSECGEPVGSLRLLCKVYNRHRRLSIRVST